MRIRTIPMLAVSAVIAGGCGGSGGSSPTSARPAAPVSLSVFVSDSRVSVSPTSVGAGPVVFVVTNQSREAEALAIMPAGTTRTLARTAPINPQGTTQVSVDVKPGTYTIATAPHGTQAQRSLPAAIRPASIHIGRARSSADNQLLQP
jgi:hypothetical protein